MVIFLDFDGVLHPIKPDQDPFCYLSDFLKMLDEFSDIIVVISSSWRHHMPLDILKSMFERHADKVIAVTLDVFAPADKLWRQNEIEYWIQENNYEGEWLAIDDAISEFTQGHPNLFLCESRIGLDDDAMALLKQRLRKLMTLT
jgi:hypothetical protein